MPRKGIAPAGGRASQHPDACKEVTALLAQWDLETHADVFVELGVERARDLQWVLDSDVEEQNIPRVAKRKMLAMLERWRKENGSEPAHKKVRRDAVVKHEESGVGGAGSGAAAAPPSAPRPSRAPRTPRPPRAARRAWRADQWSGQGGFSSGH